MSPNESAMTLERVRSTATELLSIPPVSVVTELGPDELRTRLGRFVDRRHANDAIYRAVIALRTQHALRPGAYVVKFPREAFEIPVDLRTICDRPGELAAFIKAPRSSSDLTFDLVEIAGRLADHLRSLSRDEAITAMRQMSSDGQEFLVHDRCDPSDRFAHHFLDGEYSHRYLIAVAALPEVER